MLRKIQITIILCLLAFIIACKSQVPLDGNVIEVGLTNLKMTKVLAYSEIFDSVRFIPLQTKNAQLIGKIDKIISYKGRFFVLDQWESKTVLEFDGSGHFLRQIGNFGKGPGEYDRPSDISIDRSHQNIVVYVRSRKSLLYFDFEGRFIKENKIGLFFKNFEILANGQIGIFKDYDINEPYKDGQLNFLVLSESNKIEYSSFPFDPDFDRGSGLNFFLSYSEDELLVSPSYSNTIYSFRHNKLIPKYVFNFGENNIHNGLIRKENDSQFFKNLAQSNYAFIDSFIEFPDYLIFSFVYKSTLYQGVYSKTTKNVKYGNIVINDLFGVIGGTSVMSKSGSKLVTYFDPVDLDYVKQLQERCLEQKHSFKEEWLKSYKNSNVFNYDVIVNETKSLKLVPLNKEFDTINSITRMDNPVLMELTLKLF